MKREIIRHEKTIKSNSLISTIKTEQNYKDLKKRGIDITLETEYNARSQNTGNYDSFESSGKLGYLENKELKKRVLGYYHQTNPSLIKMEEMHSKNIDKMIELMPKYKESKNLLFDPYFQQAIKFQKFYSEGLVEFYKVAIKESEKTLKLIDEELKK